MTTLGIDIAKYKHNASLLDEDSRVVFNNLKFSNDDEGLGKLLTQIEAAGKKPAEITVGMEAAGHYWILLFQHLSQRGFDVQLINPLITRARRNIGIRGSKTDGIDSLLIARLLRETDLKKPSFDELSKVDIRRLTGLLSKAGKGRMGREQAESLKLAAKQSFACKQTNRNLVLQIRMIVERLNLTLSHIKELDREAAGYFPELQRLLMTIPGIGKVWAPAILAEILSVFNPERRDGGSAFVAMAGLDPRLNDTGDKTGKARMSKRGSKYLRTALLEAASVAANVSKDPMFGAIYEKQRAKNKPHMVAVMLQTNYVMYICCIEKRKIL
ncbi:MAG: IS110 family transposase [FCB group bacterium]|nr:IS110 family transposase [FCB group bacterium]